MSKFQDLLKEKYGQLDEQIPTGQVQQPTQQTQQTQGQQPTNQQAQQQTQQQQPPPEQSLVQAFQGINFKDPNTAVQQLNTAMKNAGNIPGMQDFWPNVAYDPQKGFMYQQAQQQQQQGQQTPGATATNTQGQ